MKHHRLFTKFFTLIFPFILLLPFLYAVIFNFVAKEYAYKKAAKDLVALSGSVLPLAKNGGNVRNFLYEVGKANRKHGGNGELLIFSAEGKLIFPRAIEQAGDGREELDSISAELYGFILRNDFLQEPSEWKSGSGKKYLVFAKKLSLGQSAQISCLAAICPTEKIAVWVSEANKIVFLVSLFLILPLIFLLYFSSKKVTSPLNRLCVESERIGSGDFKEIDGEFSLLELDELRNSMNKMCVRLKKSEDTQKIFFQNVSHELRTPLMSIGGYAQGIEEGLFDSDKTAARTIIEETSRLSALVSDLLTISRIESAPVPRLTELFLFDLISDSIDRVFPIAQEKGIEIDFPPIPENLSILADEELFSKLMDNLLSNAVRYAKEKIKISVEKENDSVKISVLDDGNGITPADLPHIFERFYKGAGGKFGIGLSIAKEATEKMGGTILAENAGGARFTVALALLSCNFGDRNLGQKGFDRQQI